MANTARLTLVTVEGEGLRFDVSTGRGQRMVIDSGPGSIAVSPVDALLVALAGCHAMDVISILRKKRQQVMAYELEVSGVRRDQHPRSFTRIEIVHRLTGRDLSREAVARAIELSHTKYCSVTASLDPAIDITNRFELVPAGATRATG